METAALDELLHLLKPQYRIYGPVKLPGKGRFSDTDLVSYAEIQRSRDIVFDERSFFSPKEILFPVNQTLFYFTESQCREPETDERGLLVFLRACDLEAVKRLDQALLQTGPYPDSYYQEMRAKTKFALLECREEFEGCFCASMGTNENRDYAFSIRPEHGAYLCDVREDLAGLFSRLGKPRDHEPAFVWEHKNPVRLPVHPEAFSDHPLWQEYSERCIACGRCNVVCPTCSCFSLQDIFYDDNPKVGERRRVWASCQIDGFADLAGGHSYRRDKGERMRYKVLHKIHHFKEHFGVNLCVGCGRCDYACPEYISFSRCVNKLAELEDATEAEADANRLSEPAQEVFASNTPAQRIPAPHSVTPSDPAPSMLLPNIPAPSELAIDNFAADNLAPDNFAVDNFAPDDPVRVPPEGSGLRASRGIPRKSDLILTPAEVERDGK